jgi:hypothetical protein
MREVVPGGAADGGNDADGERKHGNVEGFVPVEQTFGEQPSQQPIAIGREFAERETGIEPVHHHAQLPRGGIEVRVAVDPDDQSVFQLEPVFGERGTNEPNPCIGKTRDGDGGVAFLAAFNEREVHVPGAGVLQPLDLAADPDTIGRPATQRVVDQVGQLAYGERRVATVIDVDVEG